MTFGFVHESRFCSGCKACQMACKENNHTAEGKNFRKVITCEGGGYQQTEAGFENTVYAYSLSISCNHCAKPLCVKSCPSGAMQKEPGSGIVFIEEKLCIGCGACRRACPYDAPQQNVQNKIMKKCDLCRDLLQEGKEPACVSACPLRLLHAGDLRELEKQYTGKAEVEPLPAAKLTEPSLRIVLDPQIRKRNRKTQQSEF